ncbi:hydroxymethylbilane synthase [Serinibacter salmoneus]|uniref:Hydroxymethylbilane synthase n=1 Tax=Serinibacter salmoneus TaxID=556530 RepID=A0A2A9CZX8_9MICO|nr:hydroxymethylbilane synthase [Serinibacter salmoneus]PFG19691.1 hydroxymethylbilane synthase [Serinibacter salmoneus]
MTEDTETRDTGRPLRVGTRRSALARAQTEAFCARMPGWPHAVEIVPITSQGDTTTASLASLGGTGVFVTALREALLAGQIDVAVHSAKDLPTAPCPGLSIAAFPTREDPRDLLVAGAPLAQLPAGARIGTGSPRRRAQLLRRRGDLEVVDIRGNIDTRIGRVLAPRSPSERLDGVVLAGAGLARLGRTGDAVEHLDLREWPTAPAQGALAVETRTHSEAHRVVATLDDPATRQAASVERAVLRLLEAGCAAPLGVSVLEADAATGEREVLARVYALDGSGVVESRGRLHPDALQDAEVHEVARGIVADLLDQGAADLAPLHGTP